MYQEIADPDELFAMPLLSSGPLAGLDAVLFQGRSPAQTEVKLRVLKKRSRAKLELSDRLVADDVQVIIQINN